MNNSLVDNSKQMVKIHKLELSGLNRDLLIRIEQIGKMSLPIYYNSSDLLYFIAKNEAEIYYTKNTENVITGFGITCFKPGRIHIMSLAVDPEYRRSGIASEIVNYIKSLKQPLTLFVQGINKSAISFYEKQGFAKKATLPDYYSNLDSPEAIFMLYNN